MRDFRSVYKKYCRDDPRSMECRREIHDYIQTATRDNQVQTEVHNDNVDVTIRDNETEINIRFGIKEDRGEAYIDHEGRAMVEDDDGEYLIVEDIPVESDTFQPDLPDVDKIRRDWQRERRQAREDYRRSVF